MHAISQIVAGGGWKSTTTVRLKITAWISLGLALALGGVALLFMDSIRFHAVIAAGISLLISVVLFLREKPRTLHFPADPAGKDLRNLHGTCGRIG